MTRKATQKEQVIVIPKIDFRVATVKIVGVSPLCTHNWSAKALMELATSQNGEPKNKKKRDPRDSHAEYLGAFYRDEKRRACIPATAIKSAIVDACSYVASMTKVLARGAVFVRGDLLPIEGKDVMDTSMVRLPTGPPDFRYRPRWDSWSATFSIEYNAGVISLENVINLLSVAGMTIGIGEARPQKSSIGWGRFTVATAAQSEKKAA